MMFNWGVGKVPHKVMSRVERSKQKEAEKRIAKLDKFRKAYYYHFTGRKIDEATNYDLCINTGSMSVDALSDIVLDYIKTWEKNRC